jgi:hypothetical protein
LHRAADTGVFLCNQVWLIRNVYEFLPENPEGKTQHGRYSNSMEIDIAINMRTGTNFKVLTAG